MSKNKGVQPGCHVRNIQDYVHKYKQLEQVISGASLGYWDWNCQTGEHRVNDRWLTILGLCREDETQHESDWSSRVHPQDSERVMPVIQAHIESGDTYVVEFRMKHKQGHWVWLQGSGAVVEYDTNNKPLRLCGTHQVITDRKQVEEALQKAHDELEMRVEERTAELTEANEALRVENTERKQAEKVLNRKMLDQEIMASILHLSLQPISLEEMLQQSLVLVLQKHGFGLSAKGGVFLVDTDAKELLMKVQYRLPESTKEICAQVPFGHCLCGLAAKEGKVIFADKIDHRHEHTYTGIVPHGHYCVPIQSAGKMLGVLNLYVPEGHQRTKDEEQFVTAIADTMAGVVQRRQAEDQIKTSLKEKEVLLREIHHRVKNNMHVVSSLLGLQAYNMEGKVDPATMAAFRESADRIKSMALVHERLYCAKDLVHVDFQEYIQQLAKELFSSNKVTPDTIVLDIRTEDVQVDINQAVPCGLIINELLSNALKHAFPKGRRGQIGIMLQPLQGKKLELKVCDDGQGLPKELDVEKAETLGLTIVNALVDQLDGELVIDRIRGTCFRILFEGE